MLKFISNTIIGILCYSQLFSQSNDKGFVEWLYQNQKYELAAVVISSDTSAIHSDLIFLNNKINYQLYNYQSFIPIEKETDLITIENNKRLINGSGCFFNEDTIQCKIIEKEKKDDPIKQLYHEIYLLKKNQYKNYETTYNQSRIHNYSLSKIQTQINLSYKQFIKYEKIKPYQAALLSTIIPGLGKAYARRPTEMIIPLFKCLLLTAITYEGYSKKQFNSVQFYTFGSLLLFNYSANIYGSYTTAKNSKSDYQKHFQKQLSDYFRTITDSYIDKHSKDTFTNND
ncbi:MAG: hypothetical protein JXR39_00995 [Marinilabiliaceae bacterium]|nr:hypothetical protein [Marinilabiliaceae bacterium]